MFTLTLNRVRDRITVKEGDETLVLSVDSDARVIIKRIRNAQEKLVQAIKDSATDAEREKSTLEFSQAIFGEVQTRKLFDFYNGDYSCVMTICGEYFEKRLRSKIIKAQKKIK